ncbi:RNA polymerase sigma factor [Schlesneria sp. DSM 10557]|uniref:RNA polymerase sigma factor n=1 Tax=Schlesneria sp. DSM 10557 TaxID=3044399 RepID=UPI00359F3255
MLAICLRQLRHREDAEDVAQQTMVRAIRHLHHWDQLRSLDPWVLTIAVNRCRTHLSQRKVRPRSFDPAIDSPSREQRLGTADLSEELHLALRKLRDEYRTCFILFYQQELSIAEVAEAMNCPEGTVKTWLHRARRELGQLLIERGVVTKDGYELHRI